MKFKMNRTAFQGENSFFFISSTMSRIYYDKGSFQFHFTLWYTKATNGWPNGFPLGEKRAISAAID